MRFRHVPQGEPSADNESPPFTLTIAYSGGLNSGDQDTNDPTQIYAWEASGLMPDQGLSLIGGTDFSATQDAVFQINPSIIVSDATANDRAGFVLDVVKYDSSDTEIFRHCVGSTYIRDDHPHYNNGAAAGAIMLELTNSEKFRIETRRLFSQDPGDDNPADATLSRMFVHKIGKV